MKHLFILTAIFLTAFSGSAQALTFNETTDFPNVIFFENDPDLSKNIGQFDIGLNRVFGTLDGECIDFDCNPDLSSKDSQDTFLFEIAPGQELIGISISTTEIVPLNNLEIAFEVRSDLEAFEDSIIFSFLSVGNDFASVITGGGADTFAFSIAGVSLLDNVAFGAAAIGIRDYKFNYALSFDVANVSAVPIPAALPLFATGLALMGFMGWRKKWRVTEAV